MTSSPVRMTDLWSTRPSVGEATKVGSGSTRRFDIGPANGWNRSIAETPQTRFAGSWAAAVSGAVRKKLAAGRIFAIPIRIAAQLPANRHSPCGKHGELSVKRIVDHHPSGQPAPISARHYLRVPASLPSFSGSNRPNLWLIKRHSKGAER
jgi:hypothetical protein